MNILFYMPTVLIGGVRRVTEILSNKLREKGYTVTWLLLYRVYGDERDFPESQNCVYLPSKELLSKENIEFYHNFLKKHNIEIIINQNGLYEGVELIDTARTENINIISVLHNNPIMGFQWLWQDVLILRNRSFIEKLKLVARILLYRRTKQIIKSGIIRQFKLLKKGKSHINVLSPRYIDTVQKIDPTLCDISAIANPNTYTEVRNCPKEKIVLYVGRLENRSKRLQLLIGIWKRIANEVQDWKLIIVGEGMDKSMLEKQADRIKNIEFVGYQDPRSYYERASILCMTSLYEGFPMTLTEGMQHGCVPMAFDSFAAVHDIMTSGVDGEIIEAFDTKTYSKKLLNLIKDEAYRKRLSDQARINVQRYDCNQIIDQWEELFRKLTAQ